MARKARSFNRPATACTPKKASSPGCSRPSDNLTAKTKHSPPRRKEREGVTAKHIQDITEYSGSAIEHSGGIIAFVPKGRTKIAQRFIAGKGLLSLPTTVSLAQAIQFIKGGSSKWVHDTFLEHNAFTWQEGYGAFSIGVSQVEDT